MEDCRTLVLMCMSASLVEAGDEVLAAAIGHRSETILRKIIVQQQ